MVTIVAEDRTGNTDFAMFQPSSHQILMQPQLRGSIRAAYPVSIRNIQQLTHSRVQKTPFGIEAPPHRIKGFQVFAVLFADRWYVKEQLAPMGPPVELLQHEVAPFP